MNWLFVSLSFFNPFLSTYYPSARNAVNLLSVRRLSQRTLAAAIDTRIFLFELDT